MFAPVSISITGASNSGKVSPLITAGLAELRGNQADPESTLRRIDEVRFNGLEYEQLFVVDKDGFVLKGYDGGKHSVGFPLDEAAKWKDYTVTHRHPSEYGGTFSFADIHCMVEYGWREHEASAKEGRYKMGRTNKADGSGLVRQLKADAGNIERDMRRIAQSISEKEYQSHKEFIYENRKQQLKVLENWYEQNLPKYGFAYKFTPREEYTND